MRCFRSSRSNKKVLPAQNTQGQIVLVPLRYLSTSTIPWKIDNYDQKIDYIVLVMWSFIFCKCWKRSYWFLYFIMYVVPLFIFHRTILYSMDRLMNYTQKKNSWFFFQFWIIYKFYLQYVSRLAKWRKTLNKIVAIISILCNRLHHSFKL